MAVVGAGPAGSLLSWHLARDGARVSLFDHSHPREKPCGGGLTPRALDLLPAAPEGDPLKLRLSTECRLESGGGAVDVELPRPVGVAARLELDGWLLRRAVEAGSVHVAERVTGFARGRIQTASGRDEAFDIVVGADGAGSLVRRSVLPGLPKARLMMAVGWFAPGSSGMLIRFEPELKGYIWLFPRRNHVGVGICAPLAFVPTRQLLGRLEAEISRFFPALLSLEGGRYAHTIPSPSADPRSILEIAQAGWALLGDAAGLADPLTGEGIYFALRSASLLAETLREGAPLASYPERVLEDFGRELLKAAALRARFFSPGFVEKVVSYSSESPAIARVLSDLIVGQQGYLSLSRRLLLAGPRLLLDRARAALPAI